jgi:hypothetical protein
MATWCFSTLPRAPFNRCRFLLGGNLDGLYPACMNPIRNKAILMLAACAAFVFLTPETASATGHGGHSGRGGHIRSGSHFKTSAARFGGFMRSAFRPFYGGGYHTVSHNGTYIDGQGPSHKGGHYVNPASGDRYGIHASPGAKGASALIAK